MRRTKKIAVVVDAGPFPSLRCTSDNGAGVNERQDLDGLCTIIPTSEDQGRYQYLYPDGSLCTGWRIIKNGSGQWCFVIASAMRPDGLVYFYNDNGELLNPPPQPQPI